jgi:hypothetical protein
MRTITQLRKRPNSAARAALAADHSAALDKAWFQQNPHRNYRARLSTAEELAKLAACNAMPPIPDQSMQVWTCVKQIFPGYRHRHYRAAAVPPWLTHDVGERIARVMFESKEGNYE